MDIHNPDVRVRDEGSLVLLAGASPEGERWLEEHLPADCPTFGRAYAVEHRYAPAILDGLGEAGLAWSL